MKRQSNGKPVISWALSIRNSDPKMLERCLSSIRQRSPNAEIVIIDNMSREPETIAVAKRFADVFEQYAGPDGTWTEDQPWTLDMAASRQRGFDLASGKFIGWLDDDDVLPGPKETERLLKLNNRWKPSPIGSKVVEADATPISLEDLLLQLEREQPEADMVWCSYLYCKDGDGKSLVWQERERIMKQTDPPRYKWAEKAHEILVPVDGYIPKHRIVFSGLLFVHEKVHDAKSHSFAIRRHFDVLLRQYESDDHTTRRCTYLAAYAATLCPEREREFVDAAHASATTHLDRCRSLLALGNLHAKQGLLNDALEAFAAATVLSPHLPDPWILGGEVWFQAEDWPRAADWLHKGIECEAGQVNSQINPRFQAIRYPVMLAGVYGHLAKDAVKVGQQDKATDYFNAALAMLDKVRSHEAIGAEGMEANFLFTVARNALLGQMNAISLSRTIGYLVDNDEPKKALGMLSCVPWNLEDHPLITSWERKLRPVKRHLTDMKAYLDFYVKDEETGYMDSQDEWLTKDKCLGRVKWMGAWINENCPDARVLDVGSFDGIVGIPLLDICPNIRYLGVDIYKKPVDRMNERILSRGLQGRAEASHIASLDGFNFKADVVIWSEVIEHVQDPATEMKRVLRCLKPDGVLLLTTPWGSFDSGFPPKKTHHGTPRDMRGHVRVLTARELAKVTDKVGVHIESLEREPSPVEFVGDELRSRIINRAPKKDPVTFAVPGALWDWNGRTVDALGMGASEKSIVQFGSALASKRRVDVYGPVPQADVYRGVRYWPREQLRHVHDGKIVVSRGPGYFKHIRETVGEKLPLILWLQDAHYPDLNAEVAKEYERIVVVSEWHKRTMHKIHDVPLEKMEVIYNPVDAILYEGRVGKVERKRDRFVYCSSPDRGLIPLLRLWPRILEQLPEAELVVAYGFKGCMKLGLGADANWTKRYEPMRREFEKLRYQKGVFVVDMIPPAKMAETFLSSGVWAYPVTDFHETCCNSATEARAAGCVPVCPPLAGLAETAKCDQGFTTPLALENPGKLLLKLSTPASPGGSIMGGGWEDEFVDACIKATKVSDMDRIKMSKDAIEQYGIEALLPRWETLLS